MIYISLSFYDVNIFKHLCNFIDEWLHFIDEWLQGTPFGQLPILEIDGKTYSQTLPICRYLAKQQNLSGKTDLDSLEIDAVAAALHDLRKR